MQLTRRDHPALIVAYAITPAWCMWLIEALVAALTCWRWTVRPAWHERHAAYLRSTVWRMKRLRMRYAAGLHCELCRERNGLQCHHALYPKVLGFEPDHYLTVLCAKHHAETHGRTR